MNIKRFKDFIIQEGLPSYNPYSTPDQKEEKCPKCGETKDLILLGPGDYKRNDVGDYRRTVGYECKNCKTVFNVDKNK